MIFLKKIFGKQTDNAKEEAEAICPYCGKVLEKRPQRKKKCPFCKNFIYVRKVPSTRKRVLVTEDGAKKIDREWESIHLKNRWLGDLEQYGITEKDFDAHKERLSKRFGREASNRDVIWSICNKLVTRTKDLHDLKMIYYAMALFLNEEGKDCLAALQQASKMELTRYKQEGVKEVRILTANDSCEGCQRLRDEVFTTDEVLEKMPIPNRDCTHKLYDKKRGFCRCCYTAVID